MHGPSSLESKRRMLLSTWYWVIPSSLLQVAWTFGPQVPNRVKMDPRGSFSASKPQLSRLLRSISESLSAVETDRQVSIWEHRLRFCSQLTTPVLDPKSEHLALDSVSHCPLLGLSLQSMNGLCIMLPCLSVFDSAGK